VAGNKRKLSRKEFNGWAEYFNHEYEQHSKIEWYLANILQAVSGVGGVEVSIAECFNPPLDPELVEQAKIEQKMKNALNAEDGAAALRGLFGNGQ